MGVSRDQAAQLTARALIEIDAVAIRPSEPFTYTSGLKSPVYVDCRKAIFFPRLRATLMDLMVAGLARDVGLEPFDAVAGGETAGIPFAAWIAERLALPMVYVRKEPKGFGRNAQIEGAPVEGRRVLLVEDLATDGGTKLRFGAALRDAGAMVEHTAVIFHHDIFPGSVDKLSANGLALHALARWADVIGQLSGRVPIETIAEVEAFMAAPLAWSAAHGGADTAAG